MAPQGIHDTDRYDPNEHDTVEYDNFDYDEDEEDSYEDDSDEDDSDEDDSDEDDSDEYDIDAESMASGSTRPVEGLAASLTRHAEKSIFDKKEFLPSGSLNGIITVQRVHGKLRSKRDRSSTETQESRHADQATVDRLANFILTRSKKVFAIMLYANLSNRDIREALTHFQAHDVDDKKLPLTGDAATSIFISSTTKRYRKPWNHFRADAFCSNQWRFLAPVFDSKQSELSLHSDLILPFTWAMQRGGGMFGEVYEVTIHPAHGKNVVHVRKFQLLAKLTSAELADMCIDSGQNSNVAVKMQRAHDQDKMREAEGEWRKEVQAHQEISKFGHQNIIRFITAITRAPNRYLLFEWADGGNLREFWAKHDPVKHKNCLTRTLVKDVMLQLRGLADALEKIHSMGFRHGDMKPENLLRVKTRGRNPSQIDVGTLKICDMGLTKYHELATTLRQVITITKYTTWRYEPPEATEENKWSRRYDTWSIGCIILEFIVWMIYGTNELLEFNKRIANELGKQEHYFRQHRTNGWTSFKVHPAVTAMMDRLSQHPQCIDGQTALGDLLRVVRNRLLVVALDPPATGTGNSQQFSANTQFQARAEAKALKGELDSIIRRGNQKGLYWLKGENSDDAPGLYPPPQVSSPQGTLTVNRRHSSGGVQGQFTTDSSSMLVPILTGVVGVHLNDDWDFPVDNTFAMNIVNMVVTEMPPIAGRISSAHCTKCHQLEFWTPYFSFVDTWNELEANRHTCGFCRMRWEICSHFNRERPSLLRFDRDQSMLKLSGRYPPVLSIRRSPEPKNTEASHIQIGYPLLPDCASQPRFNILRQCLRDCNADHPECRPQELGPLPTRLIHVGAKESDAINLCETRPGDNFEYVALSHPWGEGPHFCTTLANFKAYQDRIEFGKLPAMFKDAVVTTRELGLEYLWIDSICIIQGEGGDFDQEAKRMEDVFSSAFCVIAASSARGQNHGFLNRERRERGMQERELLAFEHEGLPKLYVSRFMDDFNKDVLESPLNKRGWVLQERALARRTIYFTDSQTYWECGKGVRCETLTTMDNKLASFLGDPNFPSKLSNDATQRGVKIRVYEAIYRQYTRLQFTNISDRPIAIAGLEKRLIRNLNAQGGFGVFDDGRSLFQRSILWQRGPDVPPMAKITSASSFPVPTWSWMGYDGGIDFVDLSDRGIDWFEDAIKSPWTTKGPVTWHTGDGQEFVELKALARPFGSRCVGVAAADEIELVCDSQDTVDLENKDLMCVVVGREKRSSVDTEETAHFILIITKSEDMLGSKDGKTVCERVGVGRVKGKYLDLGSTAEAVVIR